MATLTIHGAPLAFEDAGRGQAIVLLHGFPLDGRIFEETAGRLASGRRVIVPDLRGFGRSPPGGAFSMASLAADVRALARGLNLGRFVLGGLSMGGYVALQYVADFADDLAGLILIDTRSAADNEEGRRKREGMAEVARREGAAAVARLMFPNMLAPGAAESRPALASRLRSIMEACPPETIAQACLAMRDRQDHAATLSRFGAPVLVVVGEHDALTPPAMAREMAAAAPAATVRVIPGAGHLAPMEQPTEVARAIETFCAELA